MTPASKPWPPATTRRSRGRRRRRPTGAPRLTRRAQRPPKTRSPACATRTPPWPWRRGRLRATMKPLARRRPTCGAWRRRRWRGARRCARRPTRRPRPRSRPPRPLWPLPPPPPTRPPACKSWRRDWELKPCGRAGWRRRWRTRRRRWRRRGGRWPRRKRARKRARTLLLLLLPPPPSPPTTAPSPASTAWPRNWWASSWRWPSWQTRTRARSMTWRRRSARGRWREELSLGKGVGGASFFLFPVIFQLFFLKCERKRRFFLSQQPKNKHTPFPSLSPHSRPPIQHAVPARHLRPGRAGHAGPAGDGGSGQGVVCVAGVGACFSLAFPPIQPLSPTPHSPSTGRWPTCATWWPPAPWRSRPRKSATRGARRQPRPPRARRPHARWKCGRGW